VKFGISLNQMYPAGYPLHEQIREAVELTVAATEGGLSCVSLGHHHLAHPTQALHPIPILSRLAAESGDMALLTAVIVLPLFQPVDLAEQIATLQGICGDRFILGVGIGYREEEFETFGIGMKERLGRFLESIQVMRQLWSEDLVDHRGKYYRVANGGMPLKSAGGHITPIWFGVGTEKGFRRAAAVGDGLCLGGYLPLPMVESELATYRDELARQGKAGAGGVSLRRELYLAETREAARAEAAPTVERRAQQYGNWNLDPAFFPPQSRSTVEDDIETNPYLIGNPDDLIRLIHWYQARVDVTFLNLTMRSPLGSHEQAMNKIRLFCREVLPAVAAKV
jgi:alkanesulfonate monooxygenase SsuD/methylene tetrahydromethanopterin reductase-like flavin-dependent oxidoreductase (luciferase family)